MSLQSIVENILTGNFSSSTETAEALSLFFDATADVNVSNTTITLSFIDSLVKKLSNIDAPINTNSSFIMALQPKQAGKEIVLGASFRRGTGGRLVTGGNASSVTNSDLSTAAIMSPDSLDGVTSLNIAIINDPGLYENIDNSSKKTVASSLVLVALQQNNTDPRPINISLYFQVFDEDVAPGTRKYFCSYFQTNTSTWEESGCTASTYNPPRNRYECSCNHLTSFALVWLPNTLPTRNLNAQDIASLVFQSLSILCFLGIILHATIVRCRSPAAGLQAYALLPLVSSASTTILFVFYIALGMSVYTQQSSALDTQCPLSASVLMFVVYFFLIFMLCAKTCVGYFNYLRFVRLFPEPSVQRLISMLLGSFLVSITWVVVAVGLHLRGSVNITQLTAFKLCWFTRDVIYYFLTIPVGVFLLLNLITIVLVSARIIRHVRHATSRHQTYERMKRCVLVLLSSCVTQGLGWLVGPFLTIVDATTGNVLGWLFVVFNGLEGVWALLLYAIICSQRLHEQRRSTIAKELQKSSKESSYTSKEKTSRETFDSIASRDGRRPFVDLSDARRSYVTNDSSFV